MQELPNEGIARRCLTGYLERRRRLSEGNRRWREAQKELKVPNMKLPEPLVSIDGKVEKISKTKLRNINKLLVEYYGKELEKIKETLIVYRKDLEKRIERAAKEKLADTLILPLDFLSQNNMIAGKEGKVLVYQLPFTYAPKYLSQDDETRYIKYPEKLQRKVFIRFNYLPIGVEGAYKLSDGPYLVDKDGTYFQHYHGNGLGNCFGSFKMDWRVQPKDLPKIKDQIESLLTEINRDSIVEGEPYGLPDIEDVDTVGDLEEVVDPKSTLLSTSSTSRVWKLEGYNRDFEENDGEED